MKIWFIVVFFALWYFSLSEAKESVSPLSTVSIGATISRVTLEERKDFTRKALDRYLANNRNTKSKKRRVNNDANRSARIHSREKYLRLLDSGKLDKKEVESSVPPHVHLDASTLRDGESRLARAVAASKSAVLSTGVLLSDNQFEDLVLQSPRLYNVFQSFTALGANYGCSHCTMLRDAQTPVLQALSKTWDLPLDSESIQHGYPTFVFCVDAHQGAQTWHRMGLKQAPVSMFVPASFHTDEVQPQELIQNPQKFPSFPMVNKQTVDDVVKWLQKHGVTVHMPTAVPSSLLQQGPAVVVGAAQYIAYLCRGLLAKVNFGKLRIPVLVVLFCAELLSTTGFKFNSLQGTPFSGTDRKGIPQYINDGFQQQFGAESVIVFVIYTALALGLVLLIGSAFTKSLSTKQLQLTQNVGYNQPSVDDTDSDATVAGLLLKYINPHISFIFICIFIFFYIQLLRIFTKKQPSYNYGFVW